CHGSRVRAVERAAAGGQEDGDGGGRAQAPDARRRGEDEAGLLHESIPYQAFRPSDTKRPRPQGPETRLVLFPRGPEGSRSAADEGVISGLSAQRAPRVVGPRGPSTACACTARRRASLRGTRRT